MYYFFIFVRKSDKKKIFIYAQYVQIHKFKPIQGVTGKAEMLWYYMVEGLYIRWSL